MKKIKRILWLVFHLSLWTHLGFTQDIQPEEIRNEVISIFNSGSNNPSTLSRLRILWKKSQDANFSEEEGMVLSVISNHFNKLKQFDSSLLYIKKSLNVRKRLKNNKTIARTYHNLALEYYENRYKAKNFLDSTYMYLDSSIKRSEMIKDEVLDQANFIFLSKLYNHSGSPEKAESVLTSKKFKIPKDSFLLAEYYYELADANYRMNRLKKSNNQLDSAFSLIVNQRASKIKYKLFLLKSLIQKKTGQLSMAKETLDKTVDELNKRKKEMGKREFFINQSQTRLILASIYLAEGKYSQAVPIYENATYVLDSLQEMTHLIVLAYQGLAESYALQGNLEKGMDSYKIANELKGQIYDQVNTKKAYGTEIFAENTDLKRLNIFYQELASSRRRSMRIQQIAGGSILTVLLFFFYQLFQRQKIQKQLIATKNQLLVEKEQTHKQRLMALTGRYNERMAQTVMEVQQDAQAKFRKQMIEVGEELHDFAQGKIAISKTLLTKLRDDLNSKLTDQDQQNYDLIAEAMQAAHLEIREQSHRLQEGQALDLQINLKDFLHKLQQDLGPLQQIGELNLQLETQNLDQVSFAEKEFLDVIGLIQGAINNVILHAEADTVLVRLEKQANTFNIEIADDGKGFKVAEGDEIQSGGMHALKNRVERLGGDLEIFSQAGKGTRLIAAIPLT